jgi:hypothetical protein
VSFTSLAIGDSLMFRVENHLEAKIHEQVAEPGILDSDGFGANIEDLIRLAQLGELLPARRYECRRLFLSDSKELGNLLGTFLCW